MPRQALGLATSLEWACLAGIILFALSLRCWDLGQNGYGNEYYSAGVRSMLESWHNFFFNSFDPAGFISLDKPPVAFWIQAASAKTFGFSGLSLLLPQAIEGVASVALLFHLVRRQFGKLAGLLAALFLALTPISVAVDRSTNTESCLVLTLLLSAWALSQAAELGSPWRLLLSMALLGVGFNVKMLAALVVAPCFLLVYVLSAARPLRLRLAHALAAIAVLITVSLSWSIVYDLTPAESRPFAGSSQGNSMLELAFDHNGLQRFVRPGRRLVNLVLGQQGPLQSAPGAADSPATAQPGSSAGAVGSRNGLETVPAGPLRLLSPFLAGQTTWLLPLAVLALLGDPRRLRANLPASPRAHAIVLWAGWAVSYAAVFSGAAGIFHAYYLATMAPPLAALAAIGAASLWTSFADGGWRSLELPAALVGTAAWQYFVATGFPEPPPGALRDLVCSLLIGGTALGTSALLLANASRRRLARVGFAICLVALLVMPTAWALSSVVSAGRVQFPTAGAWRSIAPDGPSDRMSREAQVEKLLRFLDENRHGERFLVAVPDAPRASPLIIASGEPVLALGGYSGADAVLTPEELARLVAQRNIRFIMIVSEDEFARRAGRNAALSDWVRQNGRLVDPALWSAAHRQPAGDDGLGGREQRASRVAFRSFARLQLYDLLGAD